jgi:cyclophilin family peptidyl-prolyl cis-trans isomerase
MTDSERENDATLTVSEDGAAAGDARNEREISSDDVPPKPVELYDETSIVHCSTTAGPFVLELYRGWAPRGYDKASTLFQAHAFDDTHFFRCLPGFLVQFGIPYTSSATLWDFALEEIPDDPQLKPPVLFEEGTVSFAGAGKNTRSSEMFISLTPDAEDQPFGEEVWETPVGKVVEGIEVVRSFHSYGERPDQNRMYDEGRKYVEKDFPLMDRFLECTVEKTGPKSGGWDGTEARGVAAIKEAVDAPPMHEAVGVHRISTENVVLHSDEIPAQVAKSSFPKMSAYHHEKIQSSDGSYSGVLFAFVVMVTLVAAVSIIGRRTSRRRRKAGHMH